MPGYAMLISNDLTLTTAPDCSGLGARDSGLGEELGTRGSARSSGLGAGREASQQARDSGLGKGHRSKLRRVPLRRFASLNLEELHLRATLYKV